MATQLQLVNRILLRLREDEVSSTDETAYSQLIAEFVSDIHREVQESWFWHSNIDTIDMQVVAGLQGYNLSATVANGGNIVNGTVVLSNNGMLLIRKDGLPQAQIGNSSSDYNKHQMILLPDEVRHYKIHTYGSPSTDLPLEFSVRRGSTGKWSLQFWETPSAAADGKYIRMIWHNPEDELQSDGTTDNNEIYIPNTPVYLGALFMALNERGEEIGEPGGVAETRYINALSAAKEANIHPELATGLYDWYRN